MTDPRATKHEQSVKLLMKELLEDTKDAMKKSTFDPDGLKTRKVNIDEFISKDIIPSAIRKKNFGNKHEQPDDRSLFHAQWQLLGKYDHILEWLHSPNPDCLPRDLEGVLEKELDKYVPPRSKFADKIKKLLKIKATKPPDQQQRQEAMSDIEIIRCAQSDLENETMATLIRSPGLAKENIFPGRYGKPCNLNDPRRIRGGHSLAHPYSYSLDYKENNFTPKNERRDLLQLHVSLVAKIFAHHESDEERGIAQFYIYRYLQVLMTAARTADKKKIVNDDLAEDLGTLVAANWFPLEEDPQKIKGLKNLNRFRETYAACHKQYKAKIPGPGEEIEEIYRVWAELDTLIRLVPGSQAEVNEKLISLLLWLLPPPEGSQLPKQQHRRRQRGDFVAKDTLTSVLSLYNIEHNMDGYQGI